MSVIFEKMSNLAVDFNESLRAYSEEIEKDALAEYAWSNTVYRNLRFRRGHLEVLDVRNTKKMWIMHVCIFPHIDDSSPIFGFDVICGENKITGVFLDFSMAKPDHPMNIWFANRVKDVKWKKDRELPDWGKRIFSSNMVAAGQVNTDEELNKVVEVGKDCLKYYVQNVGKTITSDAHIVEHNNYCYNQKMNVHTERFLVNCGYDAKQVKKFIDNHLFPYIVYNE